MLWCQTKLIQQQHNVTRFTKLPIHSMVGRSKTSHDPTLKCHVHLLAQQREKFFNYDCA